MTTLKLNAEERARAAKVQDQQVQDTLIAQKLNAVHRAAFADKYPGQIAHILRLLCERLQLGLDKRDSVDIIDVNTWKLTPSEIVDLAVAIGHIHAIRESMEKQ